MLGFLTRKKGREAHMGEENDMYYNEDLKRWVQRGKEHEAVEESVPPPPVAATTVSATKPLDAGNPASRYVAAGDFGRNAAPPGETVKSFLTPPKLATPAPLAGGFFVPSTTQSKSEATLSDPSSPRAAERYKGYCIPKFTKPEGFPGTQEAYEATELKKFKAKIDRKEARKTSLSPGTPTSLAAENGFSPTPPMTTGGAKLDNSWLSENGGFESDSQPFLYGENGNDRDVIETAFGLSPSPVATESQQNPVHEGDPVALFAVEAEVKSEPSHPVDASWMQPSPEENAGADWYTQNPQEAPVDLNSWMDPSQPQMVDPSLQTQYMISEHQAKQEEVMTEAEYPGAIRDSDDPYDIAWLMTKGWTDPKACQEITVWLYQSYQDNWRSWHKSETFWEEFWNWYYDEGYDVIHPKEQSSYTNNEAIHLENQDEVAAAFFNSGVEVEALNKGAEEVFSGEQLEVGAPQTATEPVTVDPEMAPPPSESAAVDSSPPEEFVPESDEDFWKPSDEEQVQEAVPELETRAVNLSISPKEELTFRPPSNGRESTATTKLSPWEDEILFSLPDPWAAAPSSEEDTDDGKLPFAVFNHDGMLQFLQKLNVLLTEVAASNVTDQSTKTHQFQQQVQDLMRAIERSRSPGQEARDMGAAEVAALQQELETKSHEMQILEKQFMQREAELSNKLAMTQQESAELRQAHDAMAASLKEQENKMEELTLQLEKTESELENHKSRMAEWMAELKTKDSMIESLTEDLAVKEAAVEALHEQLEKAEVGIPADVADEMEQLKHEIESLKQSNSTEHSSEAVSELKQQLMTLQKKLLQQEKTVEEKEREITRLIDSSQGNELSANNDEVPGMDVWMDELADKDAEISQLKQTLLSKDTQISSLETAFQQKTAEHEALSQQQMNHATTETNASAELERKLQRLEQEMEDKEAELQQCRVLLESLPTKDSLISKLTSVLTEKDEELMELRHKIQESRQMESDLIGQLSAKDVDLENVVHSLLFSQKQVSRLCSYCSELGGDPHQLLSSLQVVE